MDVIEPMKIGDMVDAALKRCRATHKGEHPTCCWCRADREILAIIKEQQALKQLEES